MQTVAHARRLRREMTPPEIMLWQAIRGGRTGFKFRRQHPAGKYILDFYCASARLAVEVDGQVHSTRERIEHDRKRDAWLESWNVRMLRVPANEILKDVANVVAGIMARASFDQPLHRPSDGPPPRSGEE